MAESMNADDVHDAVRQTLSTTLAHALAFLEGLDTRPVGPCVTTEALRARLDGPLADVGVPPAVVVRDLVVATSGGLLGSAGGRCFAWVRGGSLPAALAADWLTSTWDQNPVSVASAPAVAVIEEVTGRWLKEVLGLPARASVAFLSGSQLAHTTCLAAARHRLLTAKGWDSEERGLWGAPPISILCSPGLHDSLERSVRLLGMGGRQIVRLPADASGGPDPVALARLLGRERPSSCIVVLQAGEMNVGRYDDFATLVPLAHAHGAWVHVDGAFGLWAAASPAHRHLLARVADADSWTVDGHKWLNVPYDSGYALIKDADAHRAAMQCTAPYLFPDRDDSHDGVRWNPEWSRRARVLPTYAALRELGRDGLRRLVEQCCEHASRLVSGLAALPGVEVKGSPIINQGLVRFLPHHAASGPETDAFTDAVIAAVNRTGRAFFGGTTWQGRRVMRVSVCSWRTTTHDVDVAVNCVEKTLADLRAAASNPSDRPAGLAFANG